MTSEGPAGSGGELPLPQKPGGSDSFLPQSQPLDLAWRHRSSPVRLFLSRVGPGCGVGSPTEAGETSWGPVAEGSTSSPHLIPTITLGGSKRCPISQMRLRDGVGLPITVLILLGFGWEGLCRENGSLCGVRLEGAGAEH